MSDNSGRARIFRVEVWEQIDPRGVWKPVLKKTTSAYTEIGAVKSVFETETAKAQLDLSRTSNPDEKDTAISPLECGAWIDSE